MTLPTKKTPPLANLTDYSILLYGSSGLGKTTFASQAPDVLFLATEPGTNALDCYEWAAEGKPPGVRSWKDLCCALGEVADSKHKFKSVCIDTADNAYLMCSEYVCKNRGIKGPEDQESTQSYPPITREFRRVFNRLASLDIGLITIAHAKVVKVKTPVREYHKTVPAMPGGPGDFLVGLHDIVLLAGIETKKEKDTGIITQYRYLNTKPSIEHDACDRTDRLPETLPLDYQAVQDAFVKGGKK